MALEYDDFRAPPWSCILISGVDLRWAFTFSLLRTRGFTIKYTHGLVEFIKRALTLRSIIETLDFRSLRINVSRYL